MKLTRKVLQTVIDHLPLGVTLVDAQLTMIAYDGELLRLLEFPAGLVEGERAHLRNLHSL
jgi:hypothetical protein